MLSPRLVLVLALAGTASTQDVVFPRSAAADKIHPYLRDRMLAASVDSKLPVYFVMRDQLTYEHFVPRIYAMDLDTRRQTVVAELEAHMERTQEQLVQLLRFEEGRNQAQVVSRNFLGNFVRVRATPPVILQAAAVAAVGEVWADFPPTEEQMREILDIQPNLPVAAGNGPLDSRAYLCWPKGIDGTGIVWCNTDSGCLVTHPGLNVGGSKIWVNPGEIPNNNIDDDGNGKIDDINGWNFAANSNNVSDAGGHGTNTTGVFVAQNHTTGDILGNCPNARMMICALGGESTQWDGIQYGIQKGAHGQTSSHSYKNNFAPPPNYKMHRIVGDTSLAAGLIRTNSTSNNGASCAGTTTISKPFNISAPGCVPCAYLDPNQTLQGGISGVLGCAAHNVGLNTQPSYTPCGPFAWYLPDLLARLPSYPVANWDTVNHNDYPWTNGSQLALIKPDISGATGTITTNGTTGYTAFSGTSNGTPSVSSCLVLAKQANLSLTPEDAHMAAHVSARDQGAVTGKENTWGAGQVDAWNLVKLARNIHRVNGRSAATVTLAVGAPNTWRIQLDGRPNANILLIFGFAKGNATAGELTVRVVNPVIALQAVTDQNGNFEVAVPTSPLFAGLSIVTQWIEEDPDFGPLTGSNAIVTRFVP